VNSALARSPSARRPGENGSQFVDSVVAAAIVAMALGFMLQVVADGAARDRGFETRRAALLLAQSELADVGADIPLAAGHSAGVAGDLAWRVDVTPYSGATPSNPAGALMEVTVGVAPRAGGPALATLRTLRLGRGSA
jgi:hypothetical protein